MAKKKEEAEPPFEEGMKRLEEIVARIEREEIPLEEAIRLYEEGTTLHARLAEVLENAKLRIAKLEARGRAEPEGSEADDDDGDEG